MKKWLKRLAVLAFYLVLWWVLAALVNKELYLPGPAAVFKALFALLGSTRTYLTVGLTTLRVLLAFGPGVALGVALAFATYGWAFARSLVSPLLGAVRALPVACFILLVLVWVQREYIPTFVAMLVVVPVVWQNMTQGLENTDKSLVEMARCFGLKGIKLIRWVYFPWALPYLRAGAATALGLAFKAGIAAEVLASTPLSMGGAVNDAKAYLETAQLFAWTMLVIILSLVFEWFLRKSLGTGPLPQSRKSEKRMEKSHDRGDTA